MKRYTLALCAALPLLSGCQQVTTINNTLATLAKNDIPIACGIVRTAEGYFTAIVGTPSPAVAVAESEVAAICANPPTDIQSAFATLLNAWTIIQAATVKPTTMPSPTPTPN